MADRVTHLAHLAVAPFPHCDLEQGVAVAFAAARAQGCRVIIYGPRGPAPAGWKTSRSSVDSRARVKAVAEHSDLSPFGAPAVDDQTASEPIEVVRVGDAEYPRFVHAGDAVARMREPRRQIAVVGQQQQPFRIEVEPADRVYVLADAAQKVDDSRPLLR